MPLGSPIVDVEQLFLANQRALWRFVYRMVGDADVAADAVQETFVRLIERAPRGDVTRGWLFKVAANAALQAVRTQRRRSWILRRSPFRAPTADPSPAADERAESSDRQRIVRDALAELSPRDRMALLLREEGFTHREIADAIDATTGSVGTIVARALDRLARHLPLDARDL